MKERTSLQINKNESITKEYYDKLYAHKFENLDEMD